MTSYTVWSLNAAKHLVDVEEGRVIKKAFSAGFENIHLGDRNKYTPDENYKVNKFRHNLMCEMPKKLNTNLSHDDDCDEYFFPIVPKCIGSLFQETHRAQYQELANTDIAQLTKIATRATDSLSNDKQMLSFDWINANWSTGHGPIDRIRMATENGVGYYEILLKEFKETGRKNVLIGYSQGGTIARFLAYLDEHVFKANCIEAVITIQAANFGSPVASPRNAKNVSMGVKNIIKSVLSNKNLPTVNKNYIDGLTIKSMVEFLDDYIEDIKNIEDGNLSGRDEMIITARKWLSGMFQEEYTTAFQDLMPENNDIKNTVLWCINKKHLQRIKYGSIAASKKRVILNFNFLKSFDIFRKIDKHLDTVNREYQALMIERDWSDPELKENNQRLNSEEVVRLRDKYKSGWQRIGDRIFFSRQDIPPLSQDLLIPGVYQLLPGDWREQQHKNFLGQYLNARANHFSGKLPRKKAGRKNLSLLKKIIKNI